MWAARSAFGVVLMTAISPDPLVPSSLAVDLRTDYNYTKKKKKGTRELLLLLLLLLVLLLLTATAHSD